MTYTPGIPQANQIISVTQPLISNNFTANQNAFDVNHVDFNTAGAGKHKFVSLPAIGSQTPIIPDPVPSADNANLYTKIVNSIAELFLYRDGQSTIQLTSGILTNNASAGPYTTPGGSINLARNGSIFLAGGIILKWGSGSGLSGASGTNIPFPGGSFPSTCFAVVASSRDAGNQGAANTAVYARLVDNTQFNILTTLRITLGAASSTFAFFAIGN